MKRTLVISAIALRSGGTLSILKDCLRELSDEKYKDWSVVALVKDRKLFPGVAPNISFMEFNGSGLYVRRLFYEYFYFRTLSKKLRPDIWFSLHDITPNVDAPCRAVYCHNPSPFYRFSFRDFLFDPTFGLFTLFYQRLYRINIHENKFVIVQQDWLREEFSRRFNLARKQIIVAHPLVQHHYDNVQQQANITTFIYPALPRVFKNIETVCEAIELLVKRGMKNFKLILTITGHENRYAKMLRRRFGHLEMIDMIGLQPREKIFDLYAAASCLVFASKLETWGLPITEFKQTARPIIVADLPYAHETLGHYDRVLFFPPESSRQLADKMKSVIDGSATYSVTVGKKIEQPMSANWRELFSLLSAGENHDEHTL